VNREQKVNGFNMINVTCLFPLAQGPSLGSLESPQVVQCPVFESLASTSHHGDTDGFSKIQKNLAETQSRCQRNSKILKT
jgi:hypothetical protein